MYKETIEGADYKAPECWGVCFVDSADNDYTFYPAIIFGDDLDSLHLSDTRYVFDPKTALRIGVRVVEYSVRCMLYKARKKAPKSFKPWIK